MPTKKKAEYRYRVYATKHNAPYGAPVASKKQKSQAASVSKKWRKDGWRTKTVKVRVR